MHADTFFYRSTYVLGFENYQNGKQNDDAGNERSHNATCTSSQQSSDLFVSRIDMQSIGGISQRLDSLPMSMTEREKYYNPESVGVQLLALLEGT